MKKLYYFSKSRLQFVEVKNLKSKILGFLSLSLIIFSSLLLGLYFLGTSVFGTAGNYQSLKNENAALRTKLSEVVQLYSSLEKSLDTLSKVNNDLRIAANLPPVSDEEKRVGVGGGYFDNSLDFISGESDLKLRDALSYVDEITRKISFEKKQYLEIEQKLKENKKLFEAIPAIKPCSGTVAAHGYGMRLHPILNIRRMHEGIDIITDIGTKVFAAGKGIVEFVGYRGGYGLAVEIDHGFGYKTIYAHLSKASVKQGQKVSRGDYIAKTGNSGLSSGPHLHYEVQHNGVKENPTEFFFDDMGFFEIKSNKYSSIKK
ncbi:MAG: M23 family metallopeptidase [Ignavibacteriaceae bacterium]